MPRHSLASNPSMAGFTRRLLLAAIPLLFAVAAAHGQSAQKMPSQNELLALQRRSLLAFNTAVRGKDFTNFCKQEWATPLREQFTPEKCKVAFQSFLDMKSFDLSAAAKAEPVYDTPPKIDGEGILNLQGRYLVPPDKTTFGLRYIHEGNDWKLVNLKVNTDYYVAKTAKLPGEKEINTLVLDTLLAFNKSALEKDFKSFYEEQASKYWQAQISPEIMQRAFQPFIEARLPLSEVAKLKPEFDPAPAIDPDGKLVLVGFFATHPSRFTFNSEYIYEDGAWKLGGIFYRLVASPDPAHPKQP